MQNECAFVGGLWYFRSSVISMYSKSHRLKARGIVEFSHDFSAFSQRFKGKAQSGDTTVLAEAHARKGKSNDDDE
jgi:hypothetical protein